jgi:hypothetical protein
VERQLNFSLRNSELLDCLCTTLLIRLKPKRAGLFEMLLSVDDIMSNKLLTGISLKEFLLWQKRNIQFR